MIKKYIRYIKENHEDVNPLGEEIWDDYIPFNIGDVVKCIDFEKRN
jgi:hypothetical protein